MLGKCERLACPPHADIAEQGPLSECLLPVMYSFLHENRGQVFVIVRHELS